MSTEPHEVTVSGLRVQVVRKGIRNLHLGVYPPGGRVRVAAPLALSDDAVRLAVVKKLGWIKRQRARFLTQSRQSAREMVSGESHYFRGRRYRLRVIEGRVGRVVQRSSTCLELHVRRKSTIAERERILQKWYRERLRDLIPPLLAKWEPILGVRAAAWGIKRMKTKWGACSRDAHRIWLNLELAKKPPNCLEYVVVHELAHLIERHHDDRFVRLMDEVLPAWRRHRDDLNAAPLGHAEWAY